MAALKQKFHQLCSVSSIYCFHCKVRRNFAVEAVYLGQAMAIRKLEDLA